MAQLAEDLQAWRAGQATFDPGVSVRLPGGAYSLPKDRAQGALAKRSPR